MLVSEKMDGVEGEFEVENADNLEDKVDGTVVEERTKKKKKKKKPNGTYLFRWRRYADDLKLYLRIVDVCDIDKLQLALNALTDWENMWQLYVSPSKCCVFSVGKDHSVQPKLFVSQNSLGYLL